MRANKHFSCAESFGNHGSSSWHEPLNCSREEIAMIKRNEKTKKF